ncbi:LysM peptidoglycan-binding domain-containing protein [Luteolibacter pohnpeiensis]|uniref:LysM peptidoglycan-binding domain-containing protein n=1 Tax=Luteolibacter pohnpeiensis TaxID=454153 RepID=A0A934S622_9BACT|nr:LysM peptidoglycan-binding domain-containing protein [Luteolibacter pohnpeiensis]MBK1883271.1 LysM peptidoglycan-binding domain-containing protein [Luteolibacter pohnpeiensis]
MQPRYIHFLLPSVIACALASCAHDNPNDYDTSAAYGVPDYGQADTSAVNPVYDTPAAYEDSTSTPAPAPTPTYTPAPTPSRPAATTVHTVVKGDTLWGLSKKYKVSVDAIKRANGMTKDTVVLGSKLQIPAH